MVIFLHKNVIQLRFPDALGNHCVFISQVHRIHIYVSIQNAHKLQPFRRNHILTSKLKINTPKFIEMKAEHICVSAPKWDSEIFLWRKSCKLKFTYKFVNKTKNSAFSLSFFFFFVILEFENGTKRSISFQSECAYLHTRAQNIFRSRSFELITVICEEFVIKF